MMITKDGIQDVFACVFGRASARGSRLFHLDADRDDVELAFVFWVVRYRDFVVLMDTGFTSEVASRSGVTDFLDPVESLAALGVTPTDVSSVIVSHLHWDHFSSPARFPAATFIVQRDDVDYFAGRGSAHALGRIADPASLATLQGLRSAGRLIELSGDAVIAPGLRVERVGGHTPGSQIAVADYHGSPLVLAGDASHFFENLETGTPSALIHNYDDYMRGFDRISALADGGTWFPGHDPRMIERLEPYAAGVYRVPVDN